MHGDLVPPVRNPNVDGANASLDVDGHRRDVEATDVRTATPSIPERDPGEPIAAGQAAPRDDLAAVAYTPAPGSVAVTVERRGGRGVVAVRDTGVGIAPADQARVFDRFYRADRARSRAKGGTGLGLAIARTLVRAHGGEIGLDSRSGGGTTVWFTLPLFEDA